MLIQWLEVPEIVFGVYIHSSPQKDTQKHWILSEVEDIYISIASNWI